MTIRIESVSFQYPSRAASVRFEDGQTRGFVPGADLTETWGPDNCYALPPAVKDLIRAEWTPEIVKAHEDSTTAQRRRDEEEDARAAAELKALAEAEAERAAEATKAAEKEAQEKAALMARIAKLEAALAERK